MSSVIKVADREIRLAGKFVRIARLHGDKYKFLEDPEPVIDALRQSRQRIDLFTFMRRVPLREELLPYPMEMDNLAVQSLTTFDEWWMGQLDNKTRNMIRKSAKNGVVTRALPFDDWLVDGIWKIYNETPIRQGKRFPHYGKDRETVYREEATHLDSSVFVGALFEERLVGFIKVVFDETGTHAGIMNNVSLIEFRDKAPSNALMAEVVRICTERGASYLTYSNFSYGKKQRDNLSDFKSNNGFEKVDVPRYYVPLTPLGWLAFRSGLHRGFREYVPESTAAKIRNFRTAWHRRRANLGA
jgi:hypothetical protein